MSHCRILKNKVGNDNLVNPECGNKRRVQLSFGKKDMEIRIKVEMGHHINNKN